MATEKSFGQVTFEAYRGDREASWESHTEQERWECAARAAVAEYVARGMKGDLFAGLAGLDMVNMIAGGFQQRKIKADREQVEATAAFYGFIAGRDGVTRACKQIGDKAYRKGHRAGVKVREGTR